MGKKSSYISYSDRTKKEEGEDVRFGKRRSSSAKTVRSKEEGPSPLATMREGRGGKNCEERVKRERGPRSVSYEGKSKNFKGKERIVPSSSGGRKKCGIKSK